MNPDVAQIHPQAQDNVRTYARYCAQHEFTTALIDVIYDLKIALEKQIDLVNQQRHHQPNSPTVDIHQRQLILRTEPERICGHKRVPSQG